MASDVQKCALEARNAKEELDTTAKTMTVKSRVAYQEPISELKHFKEGSANSDPAESARLRRKAWKLQ